MTNQHFNEYKSKLILEAILKSALCGIGTGFGASFVLGFVFWLVGCEILWILFLATVLVAVATGVLVYFYKFRPDEKSYARRLDRLGLEERLVTMVEMDGQDSYMATIQREDARASLRAIEKQQIRIEISKRIVAFALSLFVLGTGTITLNYLVKQGLIKGLDDIIEEEFTDYVTVSYEAEDGGTIDGDDVQDIVKGGDTTIVTAVADEGFLFKSWSDGYTNPTRYDQKIDEDIVITAIFVALEDEEGDDSQENGNGDGDQRGENGSGSQEEGDGNAQSPPDGQFNPNATAGGGQREPNNQVIDGNTFYRDVLKDEEYQENLRKQLEENENLSDAERELIKKYLGIV